MKILFSFIFLTSILIQPSVHAQVFSQIADQNGLAVSLIPQTNADGSIDLFFCRGEQIVTEKRILKITDLAKICAQRHKIAHYQNLSSMKVETEAAIAKAANEGYWDSAKTSAIVLVGGVMLTSFLHLLGKKVPFVIPISLALTYELLGTLNASMKKDKQLNTTALLGAAVRSGQGMMMILLPTNSDVYELKEVLKQTR